jgi:hypothetical protein
VLTGRIAGRSAAALALGPDADERAPWAEAAAEAAPGQAPAAGAPALSINLAALVRAQRPGYWHFNVAHALVLERGEDCGACHTAAWGPGPAVGRAQRLVQLESCTRCH